MGGDERELMRKGEKHRREFAEEMSGMGETTPRARLPTKNNNVSELPNDAGELRVRAEFKQVERSSHLREAASGRRLPGGYHSYGLSR